MDINYEKSTVIQGRPIEYYGVPTGLLGEGTYGRVEKYTGPLGDVAIKMQEYSSDDGLTPSILREVSILVRLHHPNVVSIIDAGVDTTKKIVYIVMPLAQADLHNFIIANDYTKISKKSAAYQIINGVNYCLSRDILNRDIKPKNILIYGDGSVKVADFGVARPKKCSHDTGFTQPAYSLWYRPPEILYGSQNVFGTTISNSMGVYNGSADVWAVGCALYELYTGRILFRGDDESEMLDLMTSEFGDLDKVWNEITNFPSWINFHQRSDSENIVIVRTNKLDSIADPVMREIIKGMVVVDPHKRNRLQEILKNPYFDTVRNVAHENTQSRSCLQILKEREMLYNPLSREYLTILFDWIFSINDIYKNMKHFDNISEQAIYMSIDLLRYYLSKNPDIDDPPLYICACLDLSTKIYDGIHNNGIVILRKLAENAGGKFTDTQLVNATIDVSRTLGFDFIQSTSFDFLKVLIDISDPDDRVRSLSHALLELVTINGLYKKYLPSDLALGCLVAAYTYFSSKFNLPALITPVTLKVIDDIITMKLSNRIVERLKEFERILDYIYLDEKHKPNTFPMFQSFLKGKEIKI